MKSSKVSVDLLLTIALLAVVVMLLMTRPWIAVPVLMVSVANLIIGIGIVTKLDQRVDGRLTLWLMDLSVFWMAIAVVQCWPVLLWTYRKRRLQPVPVPNR